MNSQKLDLGRGNGSRQDAVEPSSADKVPEVLIPYEVTHRSRCDHGERSDEHKGDSLVHPTHRGEKLGVTNVYPSSATFTKAGLPEISSDDVEPSKPDITATAMAFKDQADEPAWPDEVFTKYGKIAKLQDRFLAIQTRLKSERDTARVRHDDLKESQSQFASILEPKDGQKAKQAQIKSWQAAYPQLLTHQQAFDEQMQLVSDMEQSLSKLEYRLAKLHPELLDMIDACFKSRWPPARRSLRSSSTSRRPSSPNLSPLELEYYDKRGDVRLLRDRLINHTTALQGPPDDQFPARVAPTQVTGDSGFYSQHSAIRERWKIEHRAMQLKLNDAEVGMRQLWEACQEAGLDVGQLSVESSGTPKAGAHLVQYEPEDLGTIELDSPPFLPLNTHGLAPHFLKDFRWPQRGAFTASPIPDLTDFAEKRDLIEKWMGKLPWGKEVVFGANVDSMPAVEFDHTVSTPKSDQEWSSVHRIPDDIVSFKSYVMVSAEKRIAPNGEPLQQAEFRKVLRAWKSDEALGQGIRPGPKSHRGTIDLRQYVDEEEMAVPVRKS